MKQPEKSTAGEQEPSKQELEAEFRPDDQGMHQKIKKNVVELLLIKKREITLYHYQNLMNNLKRVRKTPILFIACLYNSSKNLI